MIKSYQLSDYAHYLSVHSLLHTLSRNVHLNKFVRLNKETDIATLQAQIDELRNLVCNQATR